MTSVDSSTSLAAYYIRPPQAQTATTPPAPAEAIAPRGDSAFGPAVEVVLSASVGIRGDCEDCDKPEIDRLQALDSQVRTEAGTQGGSRDTSLSFTTGPDGHRYAVNVSIAINAYTKTQSLTPIGEATASPGPPPIAAYSTAASAAVRPEDPAQSGSVISTPDAFSLATPRNAGHAIIAN